MIANSLYFHDDAQKKKNTSKNLSCSIFHVNRPHCLSKRLTVVLPGVLPRNFARKKRKKNSKHSQSRSSIIHVQFIYLKILFRLIEFVICNANRIPNEFQTFKTRRALHSVHLFNLCTWFIYGALDETFPWEKVVAFRVLMNLIW